MSSRVNKNHYRSKCPKWRKPKLGKTKPNGRYLASEVKRTHDDFVNRWGPMFKVKDPAYYYSLINRPLPKKYQKPSYPIAPVNAYVPPQSKLSYEELQKHIDEERRIIKEKEAAVASAAAAFAALSRPAIWRRPPACSDVRIVSAGAWCAAAAWAVSWGGPPPTCRWMVASFCRSRGCMPPGCGCRRSGCRR